MGLGAVISEEWSVTSIKIVICGNLIAVFIRCNASGLPGDRILRDVVELARKSYSFGSVGRARF